MAIETSHKIKCDAECGIEEEIPAEKGLMGGSKKPKYPKNWMVFRNDHYCPSCARSFEESIKTWKKSRKGINLKK